MMSNWFERYYKALNDPDTTRAEFAEELQIAAEEFACRLFSDQIDAWVRMDPEEFMGR